MLKVLFFSKAAKVAVPFFRYTNQTNLFKFVKALHYFTLATGYNSNSTKFENFFKKK